MGTKTNPGRYDCYAKRLPREPYAVLLGRAAFAPILVRAWAELRQHLSGNPSKVREALECARAMEQWRAQGGRPAVIPDTPRECYDAALDDEPLFVLLGRDPLAPILVRIWSRLMLDSRSLLLADEMQRWQLVEGCTGPGGEAERKGSSA